MHLVRLKSHQKGLSPEKFKALVRNKAMMKRRPTRGERRFKKALGVAALRCVPQRIFISPEEGKGYIADFYSEELKLVFEVDGDSHAGKFAEAYDDVRSSLLAKRGIKVVRITNDQTLDLDWTVSWIRSQVLVRRRELSERSLSYRRGRADPREQVKTPREEMDRMMAEFESRGGEVTQCPTVDPKGRKIVRLK